LAFDFLDLDLDLLLLRFVLSLSDGVFDTPAPDEAEADDDCGLTLPSTLQPAVALFYNPSAVRGDGFGTLLPFPFEFALLLFATTASYRQ
jgi:hypothetical protein